MRSKGLAAAIVLVWTGVAAAQGAPYGIGRAPTEKELRPPDAAISPTGAELPPGSGTAVQGARVFVSRGCANCHGPTGEEGPAPHLVGTRGFGSTHSHGEFEGKEQGNWSGRGIPNFPFAPLLWSWINQAMPLDQPGVLRPDEIYSLTAYLLFRNGIIQEDDVMDAKSLPQVRMPSRDRYVAPPFSEWKPRLRQAHGKDKDK